jgi:hypothetical protein
MKGFSAAFSSGDMPMTKPRGTAITAAMPKPASTRISDQASWMPIPWSFGPRM